MRPGRETLWLVTRVVSRVVVEPRDAVVPYSTCESAASFVVQVISAVEEVILVEVTFVITGGVRSTSERVVKLNMVDDAMLPAISCASTLK